MRRIHPLINASGMHCLITVGKKRVITIPKFVREALGIGPGSRVLIDGQLAVQPGDRLRLTVTHGRLELRPARKNEVSGG